MVESMPPRRLFNPLMDSMFQFHEHAACQINTACSQGLAERGALTGSKGGHL